jgi:CBS-domain-containing membrane protein
MRVFDEKFWDNKWRYVIQSVMAGVAIAAALIFFDVVNQPIIVASFGASAFIAFTAPHRRGAQAKYLVGSYIVGIIVGGMLHYMTVLSIEDYELLKGLHIFAAGMAVALSMFIMAITDTEHPPAASIAVGLVINDWSMLILVKLMAGIILVCLIQRVLRRWMIDLI